jgi:hypothetical protein
LKEETRTTRKLLWFLGLWLAGVAAVSVVGLAIKLVLAA